MRTWIFALAIGLCSVTTLPADDIDDAILLHMQRHYRQGGTAEEISLFRTFRLYDLSDKRSAVVEQALRSPTTAKKLAALDKKFPADSEKLEQDKAFAPLLARSKSTNGLQLWIEKRVGQDFDKLPLSFGSLPSPLRWKDEPCWIYSGTTWRPPGNPLKIPLPIFEIAGHHVTACLAATKVATTLIDPGSDGMNRNRLSGHVVAAFFDAPGDVTLITSDRRVLKLSLLEREAFAATAPEMQLLVPEGSAPFKAHVLAATRQKDKFAAWLETVDEDDATQPAKVQKVISSSIPASKTRTDDFGYAFDFPQYAPLANPSNTTKLFSWRLSDNAICRCSEDGSTEILGKLMSDEDFAAYVACDQLCRIWDLNARVSWPNLDLAFAPCARREILSCISGIALADQYIASYYGPDDQRLHLVRIAGAEQQRFEVRSPDKFQVQSFTIGNVNDRPVCLVAFESEENKRVELRMFSVPITEPAGKLLTTFAFNADIFYQLAEPTEGKTLLFCGPRSFSAEALKTRQVISLD